MFKLIENGELYAPEPLGKQSLLMVNDKIVKIGEVDADQLEQLDDELEIIDASGCIVLPGLIDPHEHIIGAGGEEGFTSRMPEISVESLVCSGITTVVGLLGTDTTTRVLACLQAKAKQIKSEGLSAYIYNGGFELPPSTFFGNVTDDIVRIDEVIGTGEVAISDYRWLDAPVYDMAKMVTETMLGGMMSGKAGVTHFHVGDGKNRLSLLHQILDEYEIPARCIYPTHITRSQKLMEEAIKLAKRGSFVDMDTVEENIADCIEAYQKHGGLMERLTVSSDAHTPGGSPQKLYSQFVDCVREHKMPLETILPCFTYNASEVLKLSTKGRLEPKADADVLILENKSFDIRHVFARGRHFVEEGQLLQDSQQTKQVKETLPQ